MSPRTHIAQLLSLVMLFSFAGFARSAQEPVGNPAAIPAARTDDWWLLRHRQKIDQIKNHKADLIFVGDSITHAYEMDTDLLKFQPIWQQFYGSRNAVNLGFTGDSTANVLWRLQNGEVAGISPKVAVLLIGTVNSAVNQWGARQTEGGIDSIIEELHARLPKTKILLLAILPSDHSIKKTRTDVEVNRYLLAKYRNNTFVTFLDIGNVFMKNGKLDRNLFFDGKRTSTGLLHPNAPGQEKIAQAIEPTLAKLLAAENN
jgi:lysophospholipase L1-like esterase